ncbi:hypothetical protein HUW51_23800 [Adhaeribacter swui]|uniref:Uncharacterized protein n=1 Tax=Adhaeribacter swui TaxID=2086471 RepID=A0A7G7GEJ8_9BACT|nr:hypothetical protein [Adhaeribacter swui]QNF35582.1 hypothetical protein HUW51_23800 [Adhaeribacter swui]
MNFIKLKLGLLLPLLISGKMLLAQNTGISDEARTPDASAVLDVYSTSKGMLVPRVTELQRTNIVNPAQGLLVYQTNGTAPGFYYYTGTTWTPIVSGSGSRWSLETGTNNIYYNSGFVGVGVTNPRNQMVVSNNLEIRRTGTAATDLAQLIFSNTANQGNFRIGGDGGDIFWQGGGGQALQMGSFWTTILTGDRQSAVFPNFSTGGTGTNANRGVLVKGARDASIPLSIQGNSVNQTANLTEWLNASGTAINVVNSAGNFGIGVTTPTQKLDVAGNLRFSGTLLPGGNAGTSGQVLQSTGNATAPVWADLSTATSSLNWALGGNTLPATPGIRNLGTISNHDLPFITNNSEKMRIQAGGNVGIGLTTPTERLEINGNMRLTGVSSGTRRIAFAGTTLGGGGGDPDGIIELRPVNTNEQQEMLFYVGNDNTTTYGPDRIRMVAEEIRFQNFNDAGASSIANAETQTGVNTRMIITPEGNVGINTDTPTERVDVTGNLKLTGAFMPNNQPGTAGFVLQSAGVNAPPVWVDPNTTSSSVNWALGGNNLTGIRTLGTISNFDLPFITNNIEKMRISAAGNVGIGVNTFNGANPEKLLVNAGTTTSVNAIVARGSINSYFQTNIQNTSTGNQASSDVVATANNGTETTNFINMGINGSNYVYQTGNPIITGKANDGYLLSAGQDFLLVNNNATKDMIFLTGGTAPANEAMRITANRNLGLGVTTPAQKLDVLGNFKLTGAFMPNGTAGTAGQVLQSAGENASPVWVTAGASSSWALGGNSVAALNTLGTTTAFDLPFITNNTEKMRIQSDGNVGIGLTAPSEKLEVNGNIRITGPNGGTRRLAFDGTTLSGGAGDPDGIIEVRPVNNSEQQEMLFYVGNDNTTTYGPDRIRMVAEEIRFQSFNDASLSSLVNAESTSGGAVTRMIITPAGNVGIGVIAPSQKLEVTGNMRLTGAFMPGNNAGTAGQVLQSAGANNSPVWVAPNASTTWALGGNSVGAVSNLGTTSAFDLPLITSGTEKMRITTAGNVAIGTTTPNSTLSVNGSLTMAVRTAAGSVTLAANDHVVINTTNGTATWNLPAANTCTGRIYRIINHGNGALTISPGVIIGYGGSTANSLAMGAAVEIISDGTNWRRMDD